MHIADVSHYVRPGTALDEEASKRGNSTYLVDRVIPMLPEALSNELCSLKPNVDPIDQKCVEFLLSADGRVVRTKFYPAIIRSQRRFTYKEAFAILQRAAVNELERMLHDANRLAQQIRRTRMKAGSLDLDFPESKIRLDESGRVLRIEKLENDISHQLIEEYMLLGNEAVAARLMALGRPAIYRIHEPPDDRRLQEYREDVIQPWHPVRQPRRPARSAEVIAEARHAECGRSIEDWLFEIVDARAHAVEPLGHYGLAKKKYTHFTSPIRRYADLMVHRALFQKPDERIGAQSLKQVAEHISDTERNSADAERDSKDVKLYAFHNGAIEQGGSPAAVSRTGDRFAKFRILCGCAGIGDERGRAAVDFGG